MQIGNVRGVVEGLLALGALVVMAVAFAAVSGLAVQKASAAQKAMGGTAAAPQLLVDAIISYYAGQYERANTAVAISGVSGGFGGAAMSWGYKMYQAWRATRMLRYAVGAALGFGVGGLLISVAAD